jgi:SRSO17 transposase
MSGGGQPVGGDLDFQPASRLYLPEVWANAKERRAAAGIPKEIAFRTKLEISLEQMRQAISSGIPQGTVLADPAYGCWEPQRWRRSDLLGAGEAGIP